MRFSLAFAYPNLILDRVAPADRARVWPLLDAVSVNILAPKAAALVADARASAPKIEVRTHSYLGGTYAIAGGPGPRPPLEELEGSSFTTPTQAKDRGKKDATAARILGALAHEQNGEAGLYRGKVRRRDAHGRPVAWHARQDVAALDEAYLDGWAEALRDVPERERPALFDLGFGRPGNYYPIVPSRSARWVAARDARSLMAYGTDDDEGVSVNLAYYTKLLDHAERESALPIVLYPGVGRVAGPGNVVGSDEALAALVQIPRPRLVEVCGYVGAGAEGQLVEGNPEFEAIVTLWPKLRRLAAEAAARTTKGASA